ncbi:hypothetical protein AB6U14_21905 [Klebsiella pneumoniae]
MDTLNEIELWLDGLALNDYLRIKVFARAIDMTGSETPPGELEGDAEIYSEDIPVYLKSTGTAMTRIPFRLDVAIPEGAFPLISVEAFLPENGSSEVIGYLGVTVQRSILPQHYPFSLSAAGIVDGELMAEHGQPLVTGKQQRLLTLLLIKSRKIFPGK